MKKLIVNNLGEIIGEGNAIPEGHIQVNVPDNFEFVPTMFQISIDGELVKNIGTILTQNQISNLPLKVIDQETRLQKIQDETNLLVGLNVISMTDAQRWKLLAIVLYKLGVINSNGIVQPFNEWLNIS